MNISTIRPGLLVSLSTEVRGNVAYNRVDIEPDHYTGEGTRRAKWQTDREVNNPAEYEEAIVLRSKCRSLVTSLCTRSKFGLLCRQDQRDALLAAVDQARELANGFNARASITRLGVYVIVGEVAQDDARAVSAINSEVRDLLESMDAGLKRLDVEAVREAASRAKALAAMLTPEAAGRAEQAIRVAREACRRIVKAGEAAAIEIDAATLRTIRNARTAFLDLDEAGEVATPEVQGRALDLAPAADEAPMIAAPRQPGFAFELGGE